MFTIMVRMATELGEAVKVGVVFFRGDVKPVWFSRNAATQITIRKVAFTWKTREGSALILHFSVTDGQGLYEICYNTETLQWWVEKAE